MATTINNTNDDDGRIRTTSATVMSHVEGHCPTTTATTTMTADDEDVPVLTSTTAGGGSCTGGTSGIWAATFNFTNCIVGAGAIGLGGALARSGGLISVASIAFFGWLTKISLDLVVDLSLETRRPTYEALARTGLGRTGQSVVTASKFLYAFGCLVAYVVVIKDNFGPALAHLLHKPCHAHHHDDEEDWWWFRATCRVLSNSMGTTWLTSVLVLLPLCLLRDMSPLANLSALSIASMLAIVGIVIYLYVANPDDAIRHNDAGFTVTWLDVRSGYLECAGTFVFTFVSQHTVHLAFDSLRPNLRTLPHWRRVSRYSVGIAALVSIVIGVAVYISFGLDAESDIFDIYPPSPLIDTAKLLLSITMLLTFPLPFFTCRDLIITQCLAPLDDALAEISSQAAQQQQHSEEPTLVETGSDLEQDTLREPLLPESSSVDADVSPTANNNTAHNTSLMDVASDTLSLPALADWASQAHSVVVGSVCLPDDPRQLRWPYHVLVTCKLWFVVVGLAIASPNLGDVLNLVGCATGTLIAFVIPALLSFQLRGFSYTATLLLVVGGVVGVVGTYYSFQQLIQDLPI